MTTRKTLHRIDPDQMIDPKKFENLPFHKGPLTMPAKQTMKKSEEEIEKEKDFNIKHANEWGKKDVNKAIKQIEKEQGAIKRQMDMVDKLSAFFGSSKPIKNKDERLLDVWRKRKDFNYIKKEQEVNKKKGGTRKTRRKKRRKSRKNKRSKKRRVKKRKSRKKRRKRK